MFEGGGRPHAALCQDALRGQTLFQRGDGAVAALAAPERLQQLLLRGCALQPPASRLCAFCAPDRTACRASCAELVAAILREGGLLEASSNPGSATPETLHRLYQSRAAATANPYVLRDLSLTTTGLSFSNTVGTGHAATASGAEEREALLAHTATTAPIPPAASNRVIRWRDDSPPRGHFRLVSSVAATRGAYADPPRGPASALTGGGSSGRTGRACARRRPPPPPRPSRPCDEGRAPGST